MNICLVAGKKFAGLLFSKAIDKADGGCDGGGGIDLDYLYDKTGAIFFVNVRL